MNKGWGGRIAILLVSLVLGLMLATQFKNVQRVGGNVSLKRAQELTTEIQKLNQDILAAQNRIRELEQRIWEYEDIAQDEGKMTEALFRELERTRVLAGLVDLEGPGVIVTVSVVPFTDWTGDSRIVRNVYYEDLLKLINELNAAGAEALAVNDERIISTTEIRNAGNAIVINTNRHSMPFEIKAIGNPDTLEASLKLLGGVADMLGDELEIKIRRENRIRIGRYRGPFQFQHAQVLQ